MGAAQRAQTIASANLSLAHGSISRLQHRDDNVRDSVVLARYVCVRFLGLQRHRGTRQQITVFRGARFSARVQLRPVLVPTTRECPSPPARRFASSRSASPGRESVPSGESGLASRLLLFPWRFRELPPRWHHLLRSKAEEASQAIRQENGNLGGPSSERSLGLKSNEHVLLRVFVHLLVRVLFVPLLRPRRTTHRWPAPRPAPLRGPRGPPRRRV
jgi:hypothetical protein